MDDGLVQQLSQRWSAGGGGMYPIAVAGLVGLAIVIERALALYYRARLDKDAVLTGIARRLAGGGRDDALRFVAAQRPAPLGEVLKAGLMQAPRGLDEVQAALDEAILRETPKVEARTGYLSMLGNAAMLCGLLGTVNGLISSFRVVAYVPPAEKATILAASISEAMNCTFFGLLVAIPLLVSFSVLMGRTQAVLDDMNEASVTLLNVLSRSRAFAAAARGAAPETR